MALLKEENYAPRRPKLRPPPPGVEAKRIELRRLWSVLPVAAQEKVLRSLTRIVISRLERREVHDERR